MASWKTSLREVCSAGEPLNPEIIEHVQKVWGLTVREGYGQTETTLQIGCFPGERVKPGSMGRKRPATASACSTPTTRTPRKARSASSSIRLRSG